MRRAGIDAILPEIYNSRRAFYASKHLRFLCPSRPEVHGFIKTTVTELCQFESLDGIHLDYVRYPDVILPEALQPKYGIKQDREYPQYDYCYCDVCRHDFEKEKGIDVQKLDDPALSVPWKQFRYDRITHLVNDTVIPVAHKYKKLVTAAVFPNWDMVRQQWPAWKLDAVLPMLYHSLYGEGIEWIRKETEKAVKSLAGRAPLCSGLLLFHMSPEELAKAIEASVEGGAKGVVLYPAQAMTDAHWKCFSQAIKE